jgi:hypothetical protein
MAGTLVDEYGSSTDGPRTPARPSEKLTAVLHFRSRQGSIDVGDQTDLAYQLYC